MASKFMARVFIPNPGGKYDPVELPDFDAYDGEFTPAVGDVIRWNEGRDTYIVTSRFFDAMEGRCTIFAEPWQGDWLGRSGAPEA